MPNTKLDIKQKKKDSWKIFDEIAPTYDRINALISMGVDSNWRKNFRKYLPNKDNLKCLDLATGTGDVAFELARDTKVVKVLATDMSKGMIKHAKKRANNNYQSDKVSFEIGDGMVISQKDSSYDVITVSFGIRNFNDHRKSLKNIYRVLKPGGRALILEFSMPSNHIFRKIYLFYFRKVLPLIGNLLSGHSYAYSYLNKTVEEFPYGENFIKDMRNAGFKNAEYKPLSLGIANFYIGYK